jgi:hypothetical protein
MKIFNQLELFDQFKTFCAQHELEIADFEITESINQSAKLYFENKSILQHFKPIGKDKSDSIIFFWNPEKKGNFEKAPIVYFSSEGFPTNVVANSFKDFLSLLPYGIGFIYDALSRYGYYKSNPKLYEDPSKEYTRKKLQEFIDENKNEFEGSVLFVKWLNQTVKIPTSQKPHKIIENAIQTQPNLNDWLQIHN